MKCGHRYERKRMEQTDLGHSRLIFGAGTVLFCIAGILAVVTAITCHTYGSMLAPGISWIPSAIYGVILWLWWAGIAFILWRTGNHYPLIFRAAVPNLLLQVPLDILVCTAHLSALHLATRLMGQIWVQWRIARFDAIHFLTLGASALIFWSTRSSGLAALSSDSILQHSARHFSLLNSDSSLPQPNFRLCRCNSNRIFSLTH